jgi:hypothetical protein
MPKRQRQQRGGGEGRGLEGGNYIFGKIWEKEKIKNKKVAHVREGGRE